MKARRGEPTPPREMRELYDSYSYHVFRRCLTLLGDEDEALDAMQDVFIKAMQGLSSFRGGSSPLTWLWRIATNHCLNQLRSRKVRRGQGLVDEAALDGFPEACHVGEAERAVLVRSLLTLVDRRTQEAVVYYFIDGMTRQEVSQAVGLSVPTVRKLINRFLKKARGAFKGDMGRWGLTEEES